MYYRVLLCLKGEMNDPMNDPKLKAVCSVVIERSNSLDAVWHTKEGK